MLKNDLRGSRRRTITSLNPTRETNAIQEMRRMLHPRASYVKRRQCLSLECGALTPLCSATESRFQAARYARY
jgi:hypothetical protein